jgi:hypothetical protein
MPGGDDLCDECGYHLILRKVLDLSDVRRREDGSGFEKVLKRQLQEGSSAENVLFWAKFLGFFGLLFFSLMCFFPWGIFLFAAGVVAYLFFRHRLAKQRDGSDSSINQDPVSIAVWSGVLFVQRAVGWRKPAWPFPPVHVLTVRDSEFGDEDLAELEELKEVAGVDMEGTNVSDAGLTHLQGLRNLRFVVVRRTRVTAPGAARLQTTLPDAWIWR